ncbi:MAG TPA: glutamate synthase, partial [Pseudomonas sp.]|nr:glutamate synthase [Pseudomonas sp.]
MKTLSLLALGLFSLSTQAAPAADPEQLRVEAVGLIAPFQQQLLGTVKQAMADGGPAQAVEACQSLAPSIAAQHSQAPWTVGRTALKLRNPDNAPDAWERRVLEQFAQRAAAGEPVQQLSHGEVVAGEYRYMQAIG